MMVNLINYGKSPRTSEVQRDPPHRCWYLTGQTGLGTNVSVAGPHSYLSPVLQPHLGYLWCLPALALNS